MSLVRVVDPDPVIDLDTVKAHLNIAVVAGGDYVETLLAAEDAYLQGLVDSAVETLDGPDGWLRRSIGLQTWELRFDGREWRPEPLFRLPLPPLVSVDAITYRDPAGDAQTLDPAAYWVSGVGAARGGQIEIASGSALPSLFPGPEALTIRFTAGYATLPGPIRHAILLMVGGWYEQRASVTAGAPQPVPFGVEGLLTNYQVWR